MKHVEERAAAANGFSARVARRGCAEQNPAPPPRPPSPPSPPPRPLLPSHPLLSRRGRLGAWPYTTTDAAEIR
jgi:hypothetical protein